MRKLLVLLVAIGFMTAIGCGPAKPASSPKANTGAGIKTPKVEDPKPPVDKPKDPPEKPKDPPEKPKDPPEKPKDPPPPEKPKDK